MAVSSIQHLNGGEEQKEQIRDQKTIATKQDFPGKS